MQSEPSKFAVSPDPLAVRRAALQTLTALDRSLQTLDALLEDGQSDDRPPDARDRALLNALIFGVLRWRSRLDYLIAAFSRTPLKKIKPEVLNILRMGLYQIAFLDRIPDSAAVNTSVELAKSVAPDWVVRYVNAVLRRACVEHSQVAFPDVGTDPIAATAVRKSFPDWLVRRWVARQGLQKTLALCDAVNRIPPVTVRTNTLKTDRSTLLQELAAEAESVWPTEIAPEGIGIRQPKRPVGEMQAFQRGCFQVQDEAAQLVTWMLNPQPGQRILDACAGLGGKTGHIAQCMQNHGTVLAADRNAHKLTRLQAQMHRMGITIVQGCELDLQRKPLAAQLGRFHRILIDAPCSGLGVLRRNPDAKWKSRENQLERYGAGQLHMLDCLADLLMDGGRMVYAVCSREPEEGDQVAEAFLTRHPEFALEDPAAWMPESAHRLLQGGVLRTSPARHDMDGFFAVSLTR